MSNKRIEAVMAFWKKNKTPDIERFMSKINKTESCWIWTGCFFKDDYGRKSYGAFGMRVDGKRMQRKANRQAWRFFKNEEPGSLQVLHKCDNKACVNPDHLYLGDHAQNMRDSAERKTHPHGERHLRFKINDVYKERIIDLHRQGIEIRHIANWLNLGSSSVMRVIQKWRGSARGPSYA